MDNVENKEYKFSITKKYVKDWDLCTGFREIIQNAIDSSGKMVIDVFDDTISIKNNNIVLPMKMLLMGVGTKSDNKEMTGGFSEGLLLSLMVITRCGYDIKVMNGSKVWIPKFIYDETFQEDVFALEIIDGNANNKDLEYVISGLSNYDIEKLQEEFPCLNEAITGNKYEYIRTRYGEIITSPEFSGKMFVNGLPVYQDPEFKYGYNFKPEYVTLDRDRKSINIYELKKITSLALTYIEDNNIDYSLVDKVINGKSEDADYLMDNKIGFNDEFVEGYSNHLKTKYGINDNTVVVTTESKELISRIEEMNKDKEENEKITYTTLPNKTFVDFINKTSDYSSNIINHISNTISTESNVEKGYSNYRGSSYKDLLYWYRENIYDRHIEMTNSAIDSFRYILDDMEPSYFDYIKEQLLEEDEVFNIIYKGGDSFLD